MLWPLPLAIDQLIELKKNHPCGTRIWKVLRLGADIKIECQECRRIIMIPRHKLEKQISKIYQW